MMILKFQISLIHSFEIHSQIAFHAALLEQENAILRAQIVALREELATLQQMICNRANI